MKLIYETPEIELNKYKFSDVLNDDLASGLNSMLSGEHGSIPEGNEGDIAVTDTDNGEWNDWFN